MPVNYPRRCTLPTSKTTSLQKCLPKIREVVSPTLPRLIFAACDRKSHWRPLAPRVESDWKFIAGAVCRDVNRFCVLEAKMLGPMERRGL